MARLKFYFDEWKRLPEAQKRKLHGSSDVSFIAKKLKRHFKLRGTRVIIGGVTNGHAGRWHIQVPRVCSFGMLCHELAHVWQVKREGHTRHSRKMSKLVDRMVRYCEKKGYWETELERKNMPKPEKPRPTKDELRAIRIGRRKDQIKRFESKIGYYNTLLKKAKRSLAALERHYSTVSCER